MSAKLIKKEGYTVEFEMTVSAEKFEAAMQKSYIKNVKKINIPGFRKGKAPRKYIEKIYGEAVFYDDAINFAFPESYTEAVKELDLKVVDRPDVDIKEIGDGKDLELIVKVDVEPEVEVGNYEGIEVTEKKYSVAKADVDAEIERIRERNSRMITVEDRAVEKGDIAVIDFEGFVDGVAFDGGKGENYSLTIGSGTFIPGFEEQLIGLEKDEEKEIEVTFPEDYHSEDLKGAKATFKVKVNEIKQIQIPELGEEFFEDLGFEGVNNEESLRKEVEATIRARKDADSDNKYIDDLLEAAAKEVEIDLPHNMVHEEIHRMIHQYEEHLKMQGLSLEQFLQFTNSTMEALEDQMHEEAEKRVTYRLMLEEIAKVEKIEITEEKAMEEAESLAEKYQMDKNEFLEAFGGIDMIKYDLTMRAAIDVLKCE